MMTPNVETHRQEIGCGDVWMVHRLVRASQSERSCMKNPSEPQRSSWHRHAGNPWSDLYMKVVDQGA